LWSGKNATLASSRFEPEFAGEAPARPQLSSIWAIDRNGETIDFMLSPRRTAKSAKRILRKALNLQLQLWDEAP